MLGTVRIIMSLVKPNPMKGGKELKNRLNHMKDNHDSLEVRFEEMLMGGKYLATKIVRLEEGMQFSDYSIDHVVLRPHNSKLS